MREKRLASLEFNLRRESPFSFTCRACSRCCTGKIIPVGPQEILGMSRVLGIGTTEFLSLYTENGGTTLDTLEDGRCVFSTPSGCRVHPRRPLVCRLYPLGRTVDASGKERFALYAAEPACEADIGRQGQGGTVADFLESQAVGPYLEWARRYGDLYRRMVELLSRIEPERFPETRPESHSTEAPQTKEEIASPLLSSWQDADLSLAEYCASGGLDPPSGIEESIDIHIRAIEEWLDELESRLVSEG